MAFTQEQIQNIIEEDYQSFMSIEEQFASGEENDFQEELMLEENYIQGECSSCEDIEFNSFEVIEPDMPPLSTSSPRKGNSQISLPSPDSSILESSFLEFQTPISPSTYVSSNFFLLSLLLLALHFKPIRRQRAKPTHEKEKQKIFS